jgi:NAD(P)H-hydrate repair Nnr-like enzyme with NAD(P)H-hydrate epimerase domain
MKDFAHEVRELGNEGEPSATVISIDIPSGLNSDLAQPIGEAVQAVLASAVEGPVIVLGEASEVPPRRRAKARRD